MAVKLKAKPKPKSKAKVKAKAPVKSKVAVKAKPARKSPPKPKVKANILKKTTTKPGVKASSEKTSARSAATAKPGTPVVKRVIVPMVERRKPTKRSARVNQFAFMKAPGLDHAFDVGDTVEVFCDHEKNNERIRGWTKGVVVQVDNKLVAVQFRSNIYLTEGWMVPDRILWYPLTSEHIRAVAGKKPAAKKNLIPDY